MFTQLEGMLDRDSGLISHSNYFLLLLQVFLSSYDDQHFVDNDIDRLTQTAFSIFMGVSARRRDVDLSEDVEVKRVVHGGVHMKVRKQEQGRETTG